MDKKKIIKIINEMYEKYFDYYSKDVVCQLDGSWEDINSFTNEHGKENMWWINLDDISNFRDELIKKMSALDTNGKK